VQPHEKARTEGDGKGGQNLAPATVEDGSGKLFPFPVTTGGGKSESDKTKIVPEVSLNPFGFGIVQREESLVEHGKREEREEAYFKIFILVHRVSIGFADSIGSAVPINGRFI